MEGEHVQVLTAAGSREEADRITTRLVHDRLAACVQVLGPIQSTFRWRGDIEVAEEWLCIAKTRGDLFESVADAIRAAHSYEEPEITALPIVSGSPGYLSWITEETRPEPQ